MRWTGRYSRDEQLEILYENMNSHYKLYIPRDSVHSTGDLLRRADEIEEIEGQCKARQPTSKGPATAYDRAEYYYKQQGHTRFDLRAGFALNAARMAYLLATATFRRETPDRGNRDRTPVCELT